MMRIRVLMLIAAGLAGPVNVVAADAPEAVASDSVALSQTAAWTKRKLVSFSHPLVITSDTGPWQPASCDRIYSDVRYVLLQLGARESDMHVDQRGCYGSTTRRAVDVTFSVLAPTDNAGKAPSGGFVDAQWKTVELKGNCDFLHYVTEKVLPLIPTRDAKLITVADCTRLGGIGLYAKVLVPAQQPASLP